MIKCVDIIWMNNIQYGFFSSTFIIDMTWDSFKFIYYMYANISCPYITKEINIMSMDMWNKNDKNEIISKIEFIVHREISGQV